MVKIVAKVKDLNTNKMVVRTISSQSNRIPYENKLDNFKQNVWELSRKYGAVKLEAIVTPESGTQAIKQLATVKMTVYGWCGYGSTPIQVSDTINSLMSQIKTSIDMYTREYR